MWIERPSTPSAASLVASESVGCACTVTPMSSDDPRYSNASTTSAMSSDTFGPIMWRAEELVGPRVGDELHEAGRLAHRSRARPLAENGNLPTRYSRPVADLVFGEPDGRDLGPGVDDGRHVVVVHVHGLAGDHLGRDDAFLFGLVREQLAADAVADGVHVRQVGAHLVVDDDLAARAEREPERRGVDAAERRLAPDRDEHVVGVERFGRRSSRRRRP